MNWFLSGSQLEVVRPEVAATTTRVGVYYSTGKNGDDREIEVHAVVWQRNKTIAFSLDITWTIWKGVLEKVNCISNLLQSW